MLLEAGQKVLFIGDSITDAFRRELDHAPLGRGYVLFAAGMLAAKYPELDLRIENRGIGGNTVLDLKNRWQEDVLQLEPDWLSVLVGINDCARVHDRRDGWEQHTPERYERDYDEILRQVRPRLAGGLILWEPFLVSDQSHPWEDLKNQYIGVVHRLAQKHQARLVRTQAVFRRALARRPAAFWCMPDGVHPTAMGHALMALEFLRTILW